MFEKNKNLQREPASITSDQHLLPTIDSSLPLAVDDEYLQCISRLSGVHLSLDLISDCVGFEGVWCEGAVRCERVVWCEGRCGVREGAV